MSESPGLSILLISGTHERAHYAFALAASAAALGRRTMIFATNRGCFALETDWSGLDGAARDRTIRAQGVAGLDDLRDACLEQKVRMVACDAGLKSEGVTPATLLPSVQVSGIAAFLAESADSQIITL
ncbi:DsrE/DsrF/DrsH-like family protein [Acidisoma silvae]|uniref:DsrE/DsrF/DrsH-like family protein n=1 Tax=Acidisoma silvae TaxID=2802396 RepID=A0A963YQP0_9PROT|nr:DsrE/DsrF/DrsH-like family protein [Acidisoma silvae]MCB8875046.1 DsrE/DsrF/DrsH-like family protein [Acidisoma silvae]